MNSSSDLWSDTLAQLDNQQAKLSLEELISNTPTNACYPLQQWDIVSISGEDRYSFLQGQATCDTKRLEKGEHLLGAHLNLKGRIEAAFIAIDDSTQQRILLLMPKSQIDHIKELFAKYLLFAKASLEPVSGILPCLLWQDQSSTDANLLENTCAEYQNKTLDNLRLFLATPEQLAELNAKSAIGTSEEAEAILARNGLCLINKVQAGQYLPQELNYDHIDGVSFNKGCYKGQEVVARIHFKGQVKQRLTSYTIGETLEQDISGTAVLNGNASKVGEIISSISLPEATAGCVLIKGSETESKPLSLEQNDGPELQLLSLPYAIN